MFVAATSNLTITLSRRAILAVELEDLTSELAAWKRGVAADHEKSYRNGYIAYESRHDEGKDYFGSAKSLNEARRAKRIRAASKSIETITNRINAINSTIAILDKAILSFSDAEFHADVGSDDFKEAHAKNMAELEEMFS